MSRIAILATSFVIVGSCAAQAQSANRTSGVTQPMSAKPAPFAKPTGQEKFGIAIENKPALSRSGQAKYGIAIENRPALSRRGQENYGIAIENKPNVQRSH